VRKIYKKIAVLGLVSAFILVLIAAAPIEVYRLQSSQHLNVGRISIHAGEGFGCCCASTPTGTITAKAVCNDTGKKGILTNSHVVAIGDPAQIPDFFNIPMYHFQSNNTKIGTALEGKAYYDWENSLDIVFIPFDNPDKWEFSSSAAYFPHIYWYGEVHDRPPYTVIPKTYQIGTKQEIIDIFNSAQENDEFIRVAKFGQRTGRTDGHIYQVNATVEYNNRILYNVIILDIIGLPGDSGSPVFLIDNFGRYILIAYIASGPTVQGGGGVPPGEAWTFDIVTAREAINVTIKADFATVCGFSYTILEDNTIKILGHANKNASYINFPSYIINKPVTVITIPSNVTHISSSTFNNNPHLTTIIIEQIDGCPIVLETGAFLNTSINYIYFKNNIIRDAFINCPSWIQAFTVSGVFRCYIFIAPVFTNRTVSFIWNSTATMGFTFEIYVPLDFNYADVLTYISGGQFSGEGGLGIRGLWVYLHYIYIVCIINGEVMGGDIYGDWVVHVTGGWFYIDSYRIDVFGNSFMRTTRLPRLIYTTIPYL